MQTYLNAFVVSNFKIISNAVGKPETELLQQIVGRPEYLDNGEADFALAAGIKILKGMESHFNFKYPLPKMDQAGIPDFGGGAMENWGLVTYRENALYYNPQSSAMSQKEYVASIVAHEFAHQWFGNIISPTWWEFIWLNEGFATLYEYFAADLAYPEFRYNHLMVVSTLQSVFERDAYETTRAMNTYNESPAELRSLFDFVAYDKCKKVFIKI
jgi:aminopeptidase N